MKKFLFLLLSILLLTLTSCGYKYTEEYARISEPYGSDFPVNGNLAQTVVEGRTYLFDPDITESDRNKFIKAQERLCNYLMANSTITSGMTFYVLPEYPCRADSAENAVWFGLDAWKTEEQITATLLGAMGDYTNYGYVTALSHHIAEELNWQTENVAAELETAIFQETPALLNLVYPCFTERYASPEQVAACRMLAITLLERPDGAFEGEAAYLRAVDAFAKEAGIDFTRTNLTFAYNSESCPVKIQTQYMEVFCDATYCDDLGVPEAGLDPMRDVTSIIAFFETLDARLTPVREQFAVECDTSVTVHMTDEIPYSGKGGMKLSGLFDWKQGQPHITVTSLYVLMHEYIHALQYLRYVQDGTPVDRAFADNWTLEMLAVYFSSEYNYLWRCRRIAAGLADDVSDVIGRPYDDASDEILFLRRMLCLMQQRGDTNALPYYLKTAYSSGGAPFGQYFCDTYGVRNFVLCMLYPEQSEARIGVSLDTVVDGWCDWIMSAQ